ncbi:MAG: SpoIIIAH-like family protein [Peptococcaceae bacterium]|nr:SpoIIIAH-like family protein [Peptococcaceae bacterium]
MKCITVNRKVLWSSCLIVVAVAIVIVWQAGKVLEQSAGVAPTNTPDVSEQKPCPSPDQTSSTEPLPDNEVFAPETLETSLKPSERETEFFVEYRMERERARDRQVEYLQEIIEDPQAGDDARARAQNRLLEISEIIEKEVKLENILRAKGFKDAIVFLENNAITVVVPETLSMEQETSIINLVAHVSDLLPENIIIIGNK